MEGKKGKGFRKQVSSVVKGGGTEGGGSRPDTGDDLGGKSVVGKNGVALGNTPLLRVGVDRARIEKVSSSDCQFCGA